MDGDDKRNFGDYQAICWTLFKYTFKFFGLFYIFGTIVFFLMPMAYTYFCKGGSKILSFLNILLKLPKIKILGVKITDYFAIFDGIIDLVIGIGYCFIGLGFTLAMLFVSILASPLLALIY